MAIDPICHMEVNESTGLTEEKDGEMFYFCSEHCRQKFLNESAEKPQEQAGKSCCQHEGQTAAPRGTTKNYYCPMCEGVEADQPGDCPKCGMALESTQPAGPQQKTIYTCPMHPEIEQDEPGTCPKCGMELEPKYVAAESKEDDSELRSMTLRFWVALALSLPVFLLAMLPMAGVPVDQWLGQKVHTWLQLALSTPVVLWAGWPFFVRGWRSVVTWNLNMFTLIAIGTGAAYWFSLLVVLFPEIIPDDMKTNGHVEVYFEAAAVIITLVLLGRVLELRAPAAAPDTRFENYFR